MQTTGKSLTGRLAERTGDRARSGPVPSSGNGVRGARPPPDYRSLDPDTLAFAQKVFDLARAGANDALGALLEQGLPSNLCNHRGDNLLMLAAYHGHHATARLLLEHGGDPEMRNDHGQTPLAGAAYKGDLAMVRLLLDYGAHVEGASPDGKTALMLAAMFNRSAVLELLLEQGANPAARDAGGMSALDAARAMGATDTAARLAELHASR